MGREVIWSDQALADLEEIFAYIRRDSEFYAHEVVRSIAATVDSAVEFPDSGRVVPELGTPELRERFVHSYRILYRTQPGVLVIVAIAHMRQQIFRG